MSIIGQLRHAYGQLVRDAVGDQKAFADGLIAPAIRALETEGMMRDAAPELYEALDALSDAVEFGYKVSDRAAENALSALAKARGE